MFQQVIKEKTKIQKTTINSWLCMLMDIHKGRCYKEKEQQIIKQKFLACAEDRFILENNDLKYIDSEIELMYS